MQNTLNFVTNAASPILKSAMQFRKSRSELISSNIANIDTPFYKAKDIRFENYLALESKKIFDDKSSNKLKLEKTSSAHMSASSSYPEGGTYVFYRDGHSVRNDGNNVDLDTETTEMAKNTQAFKTLSALAKKQGSMFKYAIESSSKLS